MLERLRPSDPDPDPLVLPAVARALALAGLAGQAATG